MGKAPNLSKIKRFFFEKKKQKTFESFGLSRSNRHRPRFKKVFLVLFFQKKNRFLPVP